MSVIARSAAKVCIARQMGWEIARLGGLHEGGGSLSKIRKGAEHQLNERVPKMVTGGFLGPALANPCRRHQSEGFSNRLPGAGDTRDLFA